MPRDEAWFQAFYQEHLPSIGAYCLRRVGGSAAPDVVSQVFVVAWRRREDVPSGESALPWLYGVARRVASHQFRGVRRSRRLAEKIGGLSDLVSPGPETIVVQRQESELVRRAVSGLRPVDREVLYLSAWEGLSDSQIAESLGCSKAAVDKRLARAKVRLAKQYKTLSRSATNNSSVTARKEVETHES